MFVLSTLAGAREEILELCPTERIRFQSLGLAILITSALATVSMWFALSSALGVNGFVALAFAILWGLIIIGIDRWLIVSMPTVGSTRWTVALPRLILAILLGSLISTPLVLRIFQSEINAQIAVMKEQRAAVFVTTQQNSSVGRLVAQRTKDVSNLEKIIDSGGAVIVDPSVDPIYSSLIKQRSAELSLERQDYQEWQCQLYGGAGCTTKGNGPLAKASEIAYQRASSLVATLTSEIESRSRALTASSRDADRARLNQAFSALPEAKRQLSLAQSNEDALQLAFNAGNIGTNGILIRLEALNELSANNLTVNAARFLLFLLFLVIEVLPITVKLLQQSGIYEQILTSAVQRELRESRVRYGSSVRLTSGDSRAASERKIRDIWDSASVSSSDDKETAS